MRATTADTAEASWSLTTMSFAMSAAITYMSLPMRWHRLSRKCPPSTFHEIRLPEQLRGLLCDPVHGNSRVTWVDFKTDTISRRQCSCQCCSACTSERIQNGVAHKAEHPDHSSRELNWIRRWMRLRSLTRHFMTSGSRIDSPCWSNENAPDVLKKVTT